MGEFLAISWPRGNPDAEAQARALGAHLQNSWRQAHIAPGVAVWTSGATPPQVRASGPAILIGGVMARGGARALPASHLPPDPGQASRTLAEEAWGRYVALFPQDEGLSVFRDPSGGLDALTWRRGALSLATSAGELPPGLLPDRAAIDWSAVADWLAEPSSSVRRSGIEGVETVPAGCLGRAGVPGAELVWKPAAWAGRGEPADAEGQLVEAVDLAVRGLAGGYPSLLAEISGGLDSAVVAAALSAGGLADRVAAWVNYFGDRGEGDERRYAESVADRLGVALTTACKAPRALELRAFEEVSRGLRPALNALDPDRDRDAAARLAACGGGALVSGQGGDVVFYQMPTPLIFADHLLAGGGARPELVGDLARWTRRSAWEVLSVGLRSKLGRAPEPPRRRASFLPDDRLAPQPVPHPWAADAADLPPAKRYQVLALGHAQMYLGWCRRRAAGDLIYPLLSQPVTELCLQLSALALTEGRRDRSLARRAFASRLPVSVADRRSKGDLTAFYGRTVAASREVIAPLLLDGCLADAGLIDRRRLEAALDPERMIWRSDNGAILMACLVECWIRYWQGRLPDSPRAPRPRP